jgi:hypothetical protein
VNEQLIYQISGESIARPDFLSIAHFVEKQGMLLEDRGHSIG